ncbi:hypothetical protein GPJ56_005304 [Histomonas meleagridis]|uniref:uncharacterized protein n=1 Tax=Histomonas meleagridis TaxID=135588 RepID=UPI003559D821|nr:hypothetical protein GPJ56_005304 [Histomonas meleagridis]KAH0796284.1 hypothetical protein GO595_010177 [Histomonas meleagridis]
MFPSTATFGQNTSQLSNPQSQAPRPNANAWYNGSSNDQQSNKIIFGSPKPKETQLKEERFNKFKEIILPCLQKDLPENAPFDEIIEDLYRYIPENLKEPNKTPLIHTVFGEVTPAMYAQIQQFVNNNKINK